MINKDECIVTLNVKIADKIIGILTIIVTIVWLWVKL